MHRSKRGIQFMRPSSLPWWLVNHLPTLYHYTIISAPPPLFFFAFVSMILKILLRSYHTLDRNGYVGKLDPETKSPILERACLQCGKGMLSECLHRSELLQRQLPPPWIFRRNALTSCCCQLLTYSYRHLPFIYNRRDLFTYSYRHLLTHNRRPLQHVTNHGCRCGGRGSVGRLTRLRCSRTLFSSL